MGSRNEGTQPSRCRWFAVAGSVCTHSGGLRRSLSEVGWKSGAFISGHEGARWPVLPYYQNIGFLFVTMTGNIRPLMSNQMGMELKACLHSMLRRDDDNLGKLKKNFKKILPQHLVLHMLKYFIHWHSACPCIRFGGSVFWMINSLLNRGVSNNTSHINAPTPRTMCSGQNLRDVMALSTLSFLDRQIFRVPLSTTKTNSSFLELFNFLGCGVYQQAAIFNKMSVLIGPLQELLHVENTRGRGLPATG